MIPIEKGVYTVDVDGPVLGAVMGKNDDLIRSVSAIYLRENDLVLDMTYGKGAFWKQVDTDRFELFANDIDPARGNYSYDFRDLPADWQDKFDVVVLDPPYMHSSQYGSIKKSIDANYSNNHSDGAGSCQSVAKYYREGMLEAKRVLSGGGILLIKCMDQIESGKQNRTHIWLWRYALDMGLVDEDLFVLVQTNTPAMRWKHQHHSRKNYSFLWVFRKN